MSACSFSTQHTCPGGRRWVDPIPLLDGHFAPDGSGFAVTDVAGQARHPGHVPLDSGEFKATTVVMPSWPVHCSGTVCGTQHSRTCLETLDDVSLAAQVHVYGVGCPPLLPAAAPYDQFFIPELRPVAEPEAAATEPVIAAEGEVAAQAPPPPPLLPLRPVTCASAHDLLKHPATVMFFTCLASKHIRSAWRCDCPHRRAKVHALTLQAHAVRLAREHLSGSIPNGIPAQPCDMAASPRRRGSRAAAGRRGAKQSRRNSRSLDRPGELFAIISHATHH